MKFGVIFNRLGKSLINSINESNIQCRYGASLIFRKATKTYITDCTFNNITSYEGHDAVTFIDVTESSVAEKIFFINCINPLESTLFVNSNAEFRNCIIAGCKNFNSEYNSLEKGNLIIESTHFNALIINKNKCIGRECFNSFSNDHNILIMLFLMNIIF